MSRFDPDEDEEMGLFKGMFNKVFPKGPKNMISQRLAERGVYTPDFADIRSIDNIPVFVYEHALLPGGEYHPLLMSETTKYLGEGYTVTDKYKLKDSIGKSYTVAFTHNDMSSRMMAHVRGDVFCVPPEVILALDEIHKNGKLYSREKRNIFLQEQISPFKENRIPTLPCYMYMGIPEFWDNCQMNGRSMTKDYKIEKWVYFTKPT